MSKIVKTSPGTCKTSPGTCLSTWVSSWWETGSLVHSDTLSSILLMTGSCSRLQTGILLVLVQLYSIPPHSYWQTCRATNMLHRLECPRVANICQLAFRVVIFEAGQQEKRKVACKMRISLGAHATSMLTETRTTHHLLDKSSI